MTLVATGSYDGVVKGDKRVGVKELKNRLSAYLREVRQGRRIVITDRGEVVAEMHRPRPGPDSREEILETWFESGAVSRPALEKTALPEPRTRLPAGTALAILDELRGA